MFLNILYRCDELTLYCVLAAASEADDAIVIDDEELDVEAARNAAFAEIIDLTEDDEDRNSDDSNGSLVVGGRSDGSDVENGGIPVYDVAM